MHTGPGSPRSAMYNSSSFTAAGGGGGVGGDSSAAGSSPYRSMRSASSPAKEAVLGSKAGIPAANTAGQTAAGGVGSGTAAAGIGGGGGGSVNVGSRGLAAAAGMMGPRFASPPHAGRGVAAGAGAAARPGAVTSPRVDGKEFFRQARWGCEL